MIGFRVFRGAASRVLIAASRVLIAAARVPVAAARVPVAAALASIALGAPAALAEVPGTIPLVATGESHVWWVVEAAPAAGSGIAAQANEPFLLMHHAVDEPAPSERLVARLAEEPEAIAADGAELFVVSRPAGGRKRLVTSIFVRRNPAVGHWFDGSRRALAPLEPEGDLRDLVAAGGRLFALVRQPSAEKRERERLALRALEPLGLGEWEDVPLPEAILALEEPFALFRSDGALAALGRDGGGAPAIARLSPEGTWTRLEGPAPRVAPASAGGASMADRNGNGVAADPARGGLGAVEIAGRTVLVDRIAPVVEGGPSTIRLTILRQGSSSPWASFPEPLFPWAVVGFGPEALLLEVNRERRGVARTIAFASSEPGAAVELAPPGFATHGWVHLPIIGILSVALSLAAVLFGSEAYLDARRRAGPPPVRPRGASLGQRASAWAVDLVPGVAIAWAIFGGNPLELLQVPSFVADLPGAVPALVAVGASWAIASACDVVVGRSLGKRVVGLEIISARGGPSSPARRLARALASAVCVASPVVLLLALLQPNRDGPAEMVSGTALVEAPVGPDAPPTGSGGGRSG